MSPVEKAALEISRSLANEGKIIEGGFAAYLLVNKIGPDNPALGWLRDAYMAGAEHLFSTVIATFDAGDEPTEDDFRRMDGVAVELDRWRAAQEAARAKAMKTEGSA